jgi:hypothetical protein
LTPDENSNLVVVKMGRCRGWERSSWSSRGRTESVLQGNSAENIRHFLDRRGTSTKKGFELPEAIEIEIAFLRREYVRQVSSVRISFGGGGSSFSRMGERARHTTYFVLEMFRSPIFSPFSLVVVADFGVANADKPVARRKI